MTLPIVLQPDAEADVLSARAWYERQKLGLGEAFACAFEQALDQIAAKPELFAAVLKNVRRVKLTTFPYVVYYRRWSNRVEVIAVLHGSRDPHAWHDRL